MFKTRLNLALALLLLAGLTAAPALAGGDGVHPAVDASAAPAVAPALGLACNASRSTAAPVPGAQPAPTWMITIVCGNCSEGSCPGQNIKTSCVNDFAQFGHCGAEVGLPRCSDNHYYCICEVDDPSPGF